MNRFKIQSTAFTGVVEIKREPIGDTRGYFERFFCANIFGELGFTMPIAQINHTLTLQKGTIRGMHFQYSPNSEIKVVSCLIGEILDVIVDVRKNSPTFLKHHSTILSPKLSNSLYIPQGFAHGFQALSDNCELIYLHSQFYHKESEAGLNPLDPILNLPWSTKNDVILSDRDRTFNYITQEFTGVNTL